MSTPVTEERMARAVAAVATVWFALAAAWELFGPILAGHYASSASVGIIAENMLRHRIAGPVWEYTASRPTPDMYYCHHPWGIFWTTAGFMAVLGRHDYVCRLPAVLLSAATPPLLYAIGRSVWRPAAGAAAAAAFVVVPIALAFASFNALEVPVIAWSLVALWGTVRLVQTWRRRWLAVAAVGAAMAMNADWPAFVLVAELLVLGAVRLFVPAHVLGPPVKPRPFAQWWVLLAGAACAIGLGYVATFHRIGKLTDLIGSYGLRASGNTVPLSAVLASRRYWIELSFTPIAIALGKIGAVVCAARVVWKRRDLEALPLAVLGMATLQYVVFKQGADIHVFWPHYFAAYFALAMGALTDTAAEGLAAASRRWGERWPAAVQRAAAGGTLALGIALVPIAAIARDGVPALVYARETGGRFNEKGLLIHSDGAKTAFLRWLDERLPREATVELHEGMKPTWAQVWALGGRIVRGGRPLPRPGAASGTSRRAAYLVDTRFLAADAQASLARDFRVVAVGPFWWIDPGAPHAPIEAYSFEEREPGIFAWYFVSGTEPERRVAPDPFATWELRVHFGQRAERPSEEPRTLEQKRIAHNAAIEAGDEARAIALRAEIERALTPVGAAYDDGTEIVGTTFADGARPLLTIVVRAGGPMAGDVDLAVTSKVIAKAPLSTTMPDPVTREVGIPLAIPPRLWRRGFLYADPVPIRKRPGTEVFRVSLRARGRAAAVPKRVGGGPAAIEVLRLPRP